MKIKYKKALLIILFVLNLLPVYHNGGWTVMSEARANELITEGYDGYTRYLNCNHLVQFYPGTNEVMPCPCSECNRYCEVCMEFIYDDVNNICFEGMNCPTCAVLLTVVSDPIEVYTCSNCEYCSEPLPDYGGVCEERLFHSCQTCPYGCHIPYCNGSCQTGDDPPPPGGGGTGTGGGSSDGGGTEPLSISLTGVPQMKTLGESYTVTVQVSNAPATPTNYKFQMSKTSAPYWVTVQDTSSNTYTRKAISSQNWEIRVVVTMGGEEYESDDYGSYYVEEKFPTPSAASFTSEMDAAWAQSVLTYEERGFFIMYNPMTNVYTISTQGVTPGTSVPCEAGHIGVVYTSSPMGPQEGQPDYNEFVGFFHTHTSKENCTTRPSTDYRPVGWSDDDDMTICPMFLYEYIGEITPEGIMGVYVNKHYQEKELLIDGESPRPTKTF